MLHFLFNVLCIVQVFAGLALIAVVTAQESKSEGLTGQIGTTVSTAFKGKAGREDQLNLLTRNVAIVFFSVSALVAVLARR